MEVSIPCVKFEHKVPHAHRLPRGWRPDDRWNNLMKEAIGIYGIHDLDDLQDMFSQVNKKYMNIMDGKFITKTELWMISDAIRRCIYPVIVLSGTILNSFE